LLGRNSDIAAGVVLALVAAPVALAAAGGDASTVQTRSPVDLDVRSGFVDTVAEAAPPEPVVTDTLSWPAHGAITGRFHESRGGHVHQGIDIPLPEGTPIRTAGAGRVVMREEQDGYGNYTCVAHARVTSCYGHQSRFAVKLGARVQPGQVIGFVGHSGNAPVDHLHFEVRRGREPWGTPVDPLRYLHRG